MSSCQIRLLFTQWHEELRDSVGPLAAHILRVGAGFNNWRDVLRDWTVPDGRRVVLATMQTIRSDAFRTGVTRGPHLFLVADEVHRLGSPGEPYAARRDASWSTPGPFRDSGARGR